MILLPLETPGHKADYLVVILDDVSVERMRRADPAEIILSTVGKQLVNPTILICCEQDEAVAPYVQSGDIRGLLQYLKRGFEFRPDLGDHDGLLQYLKRGFEFRPDLGDHDGPPVKLGR